MVWWLPWHAAAVREKRPAEGENRLRVNRYRARCSRSRSKTDTRRYAAARRVRKHRSAESTEVSTGSPVRAATCGAARARLNVASAMAELLLELDHLRALLAKTE